MNILERIRKILADVSPDRYLFAVLVAGLLSTFAAGAGFTYFMAPGKALAPNAAVVIERIAEGPDAGKQSPSDIGYAELMALVRKGEIRSATVDTAAVDAVDAKGAHHVLQHRGWLYNFNFPKELAAAGVSVQFKDPDAEGRNSTLALVATIFGIAMQVLFVCMFVGIGFFMVRSLRSSGSFGWKPRPVKSRVRFADVAGQEEPKEELAELLAFIKDGDSYRTTGAEAPKGVLLVGPPGTGKTLLAMALAGEASASFIALSGSDFANKFIGAGKDRVAEVFKTARKNSPCIVFIDEIDSVASSREGSGTDGAREHATTINKLLTEMDGSSENEGVYVVAATNRIDVLDPAILRKGRFDRHIFVNVPDVGGRRDILAVHSRGKPLAEDVDLSVVARSIAGFSGADIRNLVNEAAIHAARRRSACITADDFESARNKILIGIERRSVVLDDADRNLIAVHESGHAVVAANLANADPIHVATIIPRGQALGLVMQLPEKDVVSVPKSKLLTRLRIYMGGRVAEEIVFGEDEVTSGAASDIEEATRIATAMVTQFGMDPEIGMRRVERVNGSLPPAADAAVQRLLQEAREDARRILESNRPALDRLTHELLARETIYGDDVRAILQGRP